MSRSAAQWSPCPKTRKDSRSPSTRIRSSVKAAAEERLLRVLELCAGGEFRARDIQELDGDHRQGVDGPGPAPRTGLSLTVKRAHDRHLDPDVRVPPAIAVAKRHEIDDIAVASDSRQRAWSGEVIAQPVESKRSLSSRQRAVHSRDATRRRATNP
jgi:hypothetical protein